MKPAVFRPTPAPRDPRATRAPSAGRIVLRPRMRARPARLAACALACCIPFHAEPAAAADGFPAPAGPGCDTAAAPVIKANPGAVKKVLIVTGTELHDWRETTPILTSAIAEDRRLEVSVVEEPAWLASPDLSKYTTVVLHYQNHKVAAPPGALANLKRAVEGGCGLVLVHFACGAFIDWGTKTVGEDFLAIAGRVWNPKLRAHDPRGSFRVRIVDGAHPITRGLGDFVTEDELYTCLDGGVPVRILASATSRVDGTEHPMAFVLDPGRGRTFHCALGHDARAFGPSVRAMYRRGAAWGAGLDPSPGD